MAQWLRALVPLAEGLGLAAEQSAQSHLSVRVSSLVWPPIPYVAKNDLELTQEPPVSTTLLHWCVITPSQRIKKKRERF